MTTTTQTTPDHDTESPAMRQYLRFKEQHPCCILFFQVGDAYRLHAQDALIARGVLGCDITLPPHGLPTVELPAVDIERHLHRLIAAGHRCALCEQVA